MQWYVFSQGLVSTGLIKPDLSSQIEFRNNVCVSFVSHITGNVGQARLYESAVRAMRKNSKLSSDDGFTGSKKCKRGYGGAYGNCDGLSVWRECGVRPSVLC
jgi:hypothetical protein